jgi:hypothetical protein
MTLNNALPSAIATGKLTLRQNTIVSHLIPRRDGTGIAGVA